jgi:hypothetical protein
LDSSNDDPGVVIAAAETFTTDAVCRFRPCREQGFYILLDKFTDMDRNERAQLGIDSVPATDRFRDNQALAGRRCHVD